MSLQSAQHSYSDYPLDRRHSELEVLIRALHDEARLLFGFTSKKALQERQRLVEAVAREQMVEPLSEVPRYRVAPRFWKALERARALAEGSVAEELYQDRLTELEMELVMLECLGVPKQMRAMAARRYGTGEDLVDGTRGYRLAEAALDILHSVPREDEPATVPARSDAGPSLRKLVLKTASELGLDIEVRIEPGLTANAAAGDRTVFLADRTFGRREALRLAVHEVQGHMVAAFNGRAQRLGIFALGTAGSFTDQEGIAIYIEEAAGVLDGTRLRTLAGRVIVTDAMHQGARFGEVARELVREHGFTATEAVALTERSFRGGGLARDAVYLQGWLRVRNAIAAGTAAPHELLAGKLGLRDLAPARKLKQMGLFRDGVYVPSLARNLGTTGPGTSFDTSPPSLVTSLTRFEAT